MTMPTRRNILSSGVAILGGLGLAGCSAPNDSTAGADSEGTGTGASQSIAVAAEWTAMRARVRDALVLGRAGATGPGGTVAQDIFARFENAGGEYGAHEQLEHTDEAAYEEFETALGALYTDGLGNGDLDRAGEAAETATARLADAQQTLVGENAAAVFDLDTLAATIRDVMYLAEIDRLDAAATVANNARTRFEDSDLADALEDADSDAFDSLTGGLDGLASAAEAGDSSRTMTNADLAFQAAIQSSYALADNEAVAGAGHIAILQAMGWDAAALAAMGGPSTGVAHAATLTTYRARIADAGRLADAGETEQAATMVQNVFAHFEGARAHDALESADAETYEAFESSLEALQTAIDEESGVEEAVATVDEHLVTGIEALAGEDAPLLAAAFFRARVVDARERYRRGEADAAAAIAQRLFERFEEDELGFHETVEETSEDLYHAFEEEHLAGLIDAFEASDDDAVATHVEGVHSTLLEFATTAAETPAVSAAEAAYVAARGFNAGTLSARGESDRAAAVAQSTFEHFEGDPGGYHEAVEHADEEIYETFEQALGSIRQAADAGDSVATPVETFTTAALDSAYAIVESAGGPQRDIAHGIVEDTFAHFEAARVHELVEEADRNAYETFEGHLEAYVDALDSGGDVPAAAAGFANAAQYAQFAIVDASEKVPLDLDLAGSTVDVESEAGENESESPFEGGPNVVEGVPDDADHVVDMTAAAFDPKELTVSAGDTVAWEFASGEPHTVTAYDDGIPADAEYWASGDFDSEAAARKGWENGEGAIQSGQSYVHTFETTGEHEYVCIPHEAVGMVGTVIVE
ncbi:Halocyanin [Halorhabdus sp. BNX81]|nr:Halocyanin [Halorhabdus sp. BNX81]